MLVASNALSDPPRLVLTSVLLHHCRIPYCHQILTFGEEILAWNPAPGNPLLLLATLVAYGNRGLCRFLLANGMWILEDGSHAGKDGIGFSSFCSLEELCRVSMQDGWTNESMDQWINGRIWNVKHMACQPWLLAAGIRVDASWRRGVLLRAGLCSLA